MRGGYELCCLEIAQKYASLGHSVIVASSESTPDLRKYPEPQDLDVRRIFNPVRYYDEKYDLHFQSNALYLHERNMAFAGYLEANCIALKSLINAEAPDLVWIFNPLGLGPVGILDTVLSCKVKVFIYLMDNIDGVLVDHSRSVNLSSKWAYLKSKITAISCSQKIFDSSNVLGQYYKNQVVYGWVDFNRYSNFSCDSSNNKEDHKNVFKIVYFGQISEVKGVAILYKLAEHIAKNPSKRKISIDIYGKGEQNFIDWLNTEIDKKTYLHLIFQIKGFMDKDTLLEKISSYDLAIFLLSDAEPFGLVPIEAMLRKVPVMITSGTGVSEILTDKHDAIFIYDRTDLQEIYRKIVWCSENPDTLEKISNNAFITINQKCNLDSTVVPTFNQVIEGLDVNNGHCFDYVLSSCETLKYPFFEFDLTSLKGPRYRFIDAVISRVYSLPLIGSFFQTRIKNLVVKYRAK